MPLHSDPSELGPHGRSMWDEYQPLIHTSDGESFLLEACRCRDRLERFDRILRGETETWVEIQLDKQDVPVSLIIDKAASLAVSTQNMMKQLLAACRLPDVNGKTARAGNPGTPRQPNRGASVSSINRARSRGA